MAARRDKGPANETRLSDTNVCYQRSWAAHDGLVGVPTFVAGSIVPFIHLKKQVYFLTF